MGVLARAWRFNWVRELGLHPIGHVIGTFGLFKLCEVAFFDLCIEWMVLL
jgi:hypothetical protein